MPKLIERGIFGTDSSRGLDESTSLIPKAVRRLYAPVKNNDTYKPGCRRPPRKTELHDAAEAGELELLKKLLKEHPEDVDRTDEFGQTPLHLAAKNSNLTCCQKLIEVSGTGLKIQDRYGNTPVLLSVTSGILSHNTTKLLIDAGGKVNIKNKSRRNAIHIAAKKGNVDTLKLLVQRFKQGVNESDSTKQTPLHLAAENGHYQVCFILLESGASKDALDDNGQTPLHLAAKMGFYSCIKKLTSAKCDVNCKDRNGNTPLHLLCGSGRDRPQCVEELILLGADLNAQNNKCETPFHLVQCSSREVRQCFHNQQFDLQITDNKGRSALHSAAARGKTGLRIDFILSMDAIQNINIKNFINSIDKDGKTALHIAISRGEIDICRSLLKAGADGNIRCEGGSALHIAALNGFLDICSFLLEKGVEVNSKNILLMTPLHLAAKNGHTKLCEILIKRGADVSAIDVEKNNVLHHSAKGSYSETCKLLSGIKPSLLNKFNERDRTPLHIAVENKSLECCEVLANGKCDLWSSYSPEMPSPVRLAYETGENDIFECLLQKVKLSRVKQSPRDINFQDLMKDALQSKNRDKVKSIVQSCYWEESIMSKDGKNDNLKSLAKMYPNLIEMVLDKGMPPSTESLRYIEPIREKIDRAWLRSHLMYSIIRGERLELLQHPVITFWIDLKWSTWVRYENWITHGVVTLLALVLTLLSMTSWSWSRMSEILQLNRTRLCPPGSTPTSSNLEPEVLELLTRIAIYPNKVAIAVVVVLSVLLPINCYKAWRLRCRYLLKLETVAYLLSNFSAIVFLVNFTQCSRLTQIKEDWQWIFNSIAILSSWFLSASLLFSSFLHLQVGEVVRKALGIVFRTFLPAFLWLIIAKAIVPQGHTVLHQIIDGAFDLVFSPSSAIIIFTVMYVAMWMASIETTGNKDRRKVRAAVVKTNLILDFDLTYPCIAKLYSPRKQIKKGETAS